MFINGIKTLSQIWSTLEKKWLPAYVWNGDPFTFWQERILFVICFTATVLGPLALIPSVLLSLSTNLVSVAVLDIVAYAAAVIVLISRNAPFKIRAGSVFCILYVLGAGLLFFLGPIGAGYIWLLGASIIISTLYDFRVVVFTLILNVATFLLLGLLLSGGMLDWAVLTRNPLEQWLVIAVNFFIVNALVSITTVLMLHSLRETLGNEQEVRTKLQENEREHAEEKLRESETRLYAVFNAVGSIPVQGYDRDRRVVFWNRASERVYGYSRDEAMGRKLEDLIIPDGMRQGVVEGIAAWYEKGIPITADELVLKDNKGRSVSVFSSHVMITNRAGDREFFCIDVDLSEYKRIEAEKSLVEEQYRQAQKIESIGRLAGGVAHDLNNLLSPILGYSEMLLDDFEIEDIRRESVELIFQAGNSARDLVRQLLAFSRKQTLDVKSIDINKTISGFEKFLRRTIREDIELELILAPDTPPVKADIGQIEQVLMNLVVNSADAMPDGGVVVIETTFVELDGAYVKLHQGAKTGKYVLVTISDTGCGIDEETRMKIFEPFFSTKGEQGTGLGLATVYGIIKQHGGNIWVYSEPGKGTTFKLYLPVSDEVEIEEARNNPEMTDIGGTETIVLVEDNEPVRKLAHTLLRQKGYIVLVAENGEDALTLLDNHAGSISLMLIDVVMPGMNGREVYSRARKKHPDLKVLYMSGYTSNVIAHHGVLEKGVQFIQKPFTIHQLLSKIRDVISVV